MSRSRFFTACCATPVAAWPNPATYDTGFAAIETLGPGARGYGDLLTRGRNVRTPHGGDITLFAPGGALTLANTTIGNPLVPPGIITESGGNVSIFTDGDVDIGIGRIFTLRGGRQIIWSSAGDIAAGTSSKTVQSAPPTRVLIDPQSAAVQTDLAGLATGGGIGVLATVQGCRRATSTSIAPPVSSTPATPASARPGTSPSPPLRSSTPATSPSAAPAAALPHRPSTPNAAGLSAASSTAGAATAAAPRLPRQRLQRPIPA